MVLLGALNPVTINNDLVDGSSADLPAIRDHHGFGLAHASSVASFRLTCRFAPGGISTDNLPVVAS